MKLSSDTPFNKGLDHLGPARVKICGITSVEDAVDAVRAGADAIGLVFYEPSPRYVDITSAARIAKAVGAFTTIVGLFVNANTESINAVLSQVPLHVLQFHGDESVAFCEQFQRPYMKAIRMKPGIDVTAAIGSYPSASGILLDAYQKGVPGGTGEVFDWDRVPVSGQGEQAHYPPIILAGGLNSSNVKQAVQQVHPYAVDVSGGVEVSPGKKDAQKVANFINQAKSA